MSMKNSLLISPNAPWLAPLSGYSDLAFRLLCREYGCAVACTEMISAKAILYNSIPTLKMLKTTEGDSPLVVQLFGSEVSSLGEAVSFLKDRGFVFFDLNAGCPVKKVTRTGAGAGLLRDVNLLLRIVEVMVKVAGEAKVGVKIRLGWNSRCPVFLDLAKALEEVGVAWITIHPRFAREGFSGRARWECLRMVKQELSIPVIASGDLFTPEDALRCLKIGEVDGVMFARGALKNPFIFRDYLSLLHGNEVIEKEDASIIEERVSMVRRHVELIQEIYGENNRVLYKLRGIFARYIRGFPHSRSLREEAVRIESWHNVRELIKKMEESICPEG